MLDKRELNMSPSVNKDFIISIIIIRDHQDNLNSIKTGYCIFSQIRVQSEQKNLLFFFRRMN